MPVYTYTCDECGVCFDAQQKFSDAPITDCPECGGHTHRVPQAVGIVFRGSGWYSTDSGRHSNLATPPKREGESTDKPDKPEKADNTDSKPAAPSTDKPE